MAGCLCHPQLLPPAGTLLPMGPRSPAGQQSIAQPCSPGSSQGFGNLVRSMGQGLCLCPLLLYPITGPDS